MSNQRRPPSLPLESRLPLPSNDSIYNPPPALRPDRPFDDAASTTSTSFFRSPRQSFAQPSSSETSQNTPKRVNFEIPPISSPRKQEKPLPRTPIEPTPPSASPSSPKLRTIDLDPAYPQPHFHRAWYKECHHRLDSVRVPLGARGELDEKGYPLNNHKLCMCDSPDKYTYEQIDLDADEGSDFPEKVVVENFWAFFKERKKTERRSFGLPASIGGSSGVGYAKSLVESVNKSVKKVMSSEAKKEKKVFRFVPVWVRAEGRCEECTRKKAEAPPERRIFGQLVL
ncbi:hypothetical protein H072_10366 [Dactylellina haptotyla CBS 200.50]|uniref:Uncharacterized protein n=1 Tax=Dactylellina haptotyla (strain CBS 200.50) TaxID=1284197 RepID=S8BLP2_DACHA|nr:hypothetical protein H072_10366 [Dactylellina haptotyla CBS 200.50]